MDVPEISPKDFSQKLAAGEPLVVLDVREPYEVAWVKLDDPRVVFAPMSKLGSLGLNALPVTATDPEEEIVVVCHHGVRSAQVTAWLQAQNWQRVFSLAGGLDAYALQVDPSIGRY
jgi:rhodanese-related sulfurtransferase